MQDGKTVYDVLPEEFARSMKDIVNMGARVIGGCCGTVSYTHLRLPVQM